MTNLMRADADVMAEIARIGRLRAPVEACGLILPLPYPRSNREPDWIIELPNRSLEPSSFEIIAEDIRLALTPWAEHYQGHPEVEKVGVWHTHPGGSIGPGREDMKNRPENIPCLVVALHEDGTHTATWY